MKGAGFAALKELFQASIRAFAPNPLPLATLDATGDWRAGALLAGIGAWLYFQLHGSLAQLEGLAPLTGLSDPIVVERDAMGMPTICGETRLDVARATGFVHAQERFFQMDLLRRAAAGDSHPMALSSRFANPPPCTVPIGL